MLLTAKICITRKYLYYSKMRSTISYCMRGFQKQSTTIILDCLDGLDSETFYNNIFLTTVTAAVAEIPLYYKKNVLFENNCKCL